MQDDNEIREEQQEGEQDMAEYQAPKEHQEQNAPDEHQEGPIELDQDLKNEILAELRVIKESSRSKNPTTNGQERTG